MTRHFSPERVMHNVFLREFFFKRVPLYLYVEVDD